MKRPRMAIAGEATIEDGKGISRLGCCRAGGGAMAMPYHARFLSEIFY